MSILWIVQIVRIVCVLAGVSVLVWALHGLGVFDPYTYPPNHWFGRFRR